MAHPDTDKSSSRPAGWSSQASLPKEILQEFSAGKAARRYKSGQIIFYEDNTPQGVYFVQEGKIKLTKYTAEGKTYIARIAKAGDLLGYRAFLTHEPYAATAEVIENAAVCFLDRDAFMKVLQKYPGLSFQLMEQLGSDLKQAENRARDLAYKSVPERLAGLLLSMKENYGEPLPDGTVRLDIRLTREELASILGTTVETTVRNLTRFRQQQLIAFDKKEIVLMDIPGLAEYIPGI